MRAFVYVPLALLAVVVLGMRNPDPPSEFRELTGATAQHLVIDLWLAKEDGSIAAVEADVKYSCSDGSDYATRWRLDRSPGASFARDRDRIRARYRLTRTEAGAVEKQRFDLHGWVVRDSAAGTLSSVISRTERGRTSTCRTYDVEWSASR